METLIKEFAGKIKVYFAVNTMTAFIKLKSRFENDGYGVVLGSFSRQHSFKGCEITGEEVNLIKERLVKALLYNECPDYDLVHINFRPNKNRTWSYEQEDYIEESDEDYSEGTYYDHKLDERKSYDLSLPTWSEYRKSEDFLNIYGRQFLTETLIFEW